MDDDYHPSLAHSHSGTSTTSNKDPALDRYMKDPYSIDKAMGEVETIRDIRKEAVDRDLPRKYMSSPMIQDLMYPEHSVSALAQPGGFRRHAVAVKAKRTFADKYDAFLDLLPQFPVIERDDDDDTTLTDAHKTGSVKAFFTLFKSYCGGGLVYFPRSFSLAGLLPACIIVCTLSVISTFCGLLLLSTKRTMEKRGYHIASYADLAGATMGKTGLWATNGAMIMSQLGFCCTYFLYASNYAQMLARQFTHCDSNPALWILSTCAIPIFYCLMLVRHIKHFALPALLADAFILIVVLYIVFYDVSQLAELGEGDWNAFHSTSGTLMLLGTTCYAFEGTVLVIPVEQSMRNPSKFPAVFLAVMAVYTALIVALGSVHYVLHGTNTGTLALENLPMAEDGSKLLTLFYLFVVFTSFPVLMYPVSVTVERWLGFRALRSGKKWRKNAVRLVLALFTYVVSVSAASFLDYVISIMGGAFCTPLALLLPPLMQLYVKMGWTPGDVAGKGGAGSEEEGLGFSSAAVNPTYGTEGYKPIAPVEEEPLCEEGEATKEGEKQGGALLNLDPSVTTLTGLVWLATLAGTLATCMAIYSMFNPDTDPITPEEYCSGGGVQ